MSSSLLSPAVSRISGSFTLDSFLTSIADKIYNDLLHNRIEPESEKILWKNENGFRRNQFMTS